MLKTFTGIRSSFWLYIGSRIKVKTFIVDVNEITMLTTFKILAWIRCFDLASNNWWPICSYFICFFSLLQKFLACFKNLFSLPTIPTVLNTIANSLSLIASIFYYINFFKPSLLNNDWLIKISFYINHSPLTQLIMIML